MLPPLESRHLIVEKFRANKYSFYLDGSALLYIREFHDWDLTAEASLEEILGLRF